MKLLFLALLLVSFSVYGQSDTLKTENPAMDMERVMDRLYIVLDDDNLLKLDSVLLAQINPEWIEEITLVNDETQEGKQGNNSVLGILIFPKQQYKSEIVRLWELNQLNTSDDQE